MGENIKETPLRANNIALYKSVEGVTYFKLKSEFPGDYTKNCGLLGEEIDRNFYFLRGYDIESIDIDKETRNLILRRVDKDYEPLIVNIGEELGQPTFNFKKDEGIIEVKYPDGSISTMEGFLIEGKDIRIATDSTLDGDGTIFNPLRISDVETTGTFAPVEEYFDLTKNPGMPEGRGKGYRIITKERVDNFGRLYTLKDVKTIQDKLSETGSQWRIPTKKDWDELLNAFECAEKRDHDSNVCTWLGEKAGAALKSNNIWEDYKVLPNEVITKGQDVVGLSIYPLGVTPDRNSILNDKDFDAEGFGQMAGMWTNTFTEEGNAFVKIFGYNSAKVNQDTYGEGARMSIRLVKDYNYSNFNSIENILGLPYPTELVYGNNEDYPYVKIWTKINVYFEGSSLNGIVSEQWANVSDKDKGVKEIFFINEWDGFEWHKKPMNNGDSVVIVNHLTPNHEWRVINGELIDTVAVIKSEIIEDLRRIEQRIDIEIKNREAEDEKLSIKIHDIHNEVERESENRINDINSVKVELDILNTKITSEAKWRERKDKELQEKVDSISIRHEEDIKKEILERQNADAKLIEVIDSKVAELKKTDESLSNRISNEVKERENNDLALKQEIENRDSSLRGLIKNEELARIESDDIITTELHVEISNRKNNDVQPGDYILDSNKTMVLPTNGEDVDDVKINISDNFFNFGTF